MHPVNDDLHADEVPMTEAQRVYLDALANQSGEPTPPDLTRDEALQKIEELRHMTEHLPEDNQEIDTEDDPNLDQAG